MIRISLVAGAIAVFAVSALVGQQDFRRNARYWLPASYNHAFYEKYEEAARSFYAAHYAHFGVYEAGMDSRELLDRNIEGLVERVRELIAAPPRFEPPVDVVAPKWNRLGYPTAAAMSWTHHLHEQLYDILTDDGVVDKKAAGERAIAHYLSSPTMAFSTRGYGHAFMMGGGSWAGEFARRYPEANGILWAYHWHHAAIYEALLEPDADARARELDRVLTVFVDSVLPNPPRYMPLTAETAPKFGKLFPAAAHIFDNLHMMHDVVNDIMVSEKDRAEQGAEIQRMLELQWYKDQDLVTPPAIPMGMHGDMPASAMIPPRQLPDGSWLPQGHPEGGMGQHQHRDRGDR